tara:strand:- start:2296 stop:2439 length:144 start_codon:yes stop_codon:yes gene_type:complete
MNKKENISLQLHRELMEKERKNKEIRKKIIEIARREREKVDRQSRPL